MNPQVVLICTVFGTLLFKLLLPRKARDFLVPWALAYNFLVVVVIGTVQSEGGVFHFMFTAMNFFPIMILCDGLNLAEARRNPAWGAFLFFYFYMTLVGFTGYFPIDGTTFYVQCLLNTFCAGFYTARWVCRTEGGLKKLLFPLLVVSVVSVLFYVIRQGSLTMELDQYGRMDMSEENEVIEDKINVNGIALRLCSLLPFTLLGVFVLRNKIMKGVALCCLLLLGLVLVRTGSRNGILAMMPAAWFFVHNSPSGRLKVKQFIVLGVIGAMFVVGILMTNKGVESVRAFDFKGKEQQQIYGTVMDSMTTGRWSMYMNHIEQMTENELIFGKGCSFSLYTHLGDRIEKFRGANAHSNYVTILYRSGIVGLVLIGLVILIFTAQTHNSGWRGRLARFLFSTWLLAGVGESWGMNGGIVALLAGMGMGFASRMRAQNSEFGEMVPMPRGFRG